MNNRTIQHLFITFLCGWLTPSFASTINDINTPPDTTYTIIYQGNTFDISNTLQAQQFKQQLENTPALLGQLENFINTPLDEINTPATLNTIKHLLIGIQTAPELEVRLKKAEQAHADLRQHLKTLKEQPHSDDATQQMLDKAHQYLSAKEPEHFHETLTRFTERLQQQQKPNRQALAELNYLQALEYASRFMYGHAIIKLEEATASTNESRHWSQYGVYLTKVERYEPAIKAFNVALTMDPNYPNVAYLYTLLGQAHEASGDFNQATKSYTKALTININTLGESHHTTALSYSHLASAFKKNKEYDQAIKAYKKALNIDFDLFGLENPYVAMHYNNIGTVWSLKNDPDQAISYYIKALNISVNVDGHEHIRVANRYYNLGLAWNAKKDPSYAILHFTKALVIYLSNYGKNHPNVVRLYNSLGNTEFAQGHYDNAINYFTESLEISRQSIIKNSPLISQQYNNLGVAWKAKGNIDLAIEYYTKALMSSLNTKEKNKTDLAAHYSNLGNAWTQKGNNEQAIESYQKSLALLIQKFGDKHPLTIPIENKLNIALAQKNKNISVAANNSP